VVARIRGYCIAGGNELNLACDLAVASEDSQFGFAGPLVGSVPVVFGTQLMPIAVAKAWLNLEGDALLGHSLRAGVEMLAPLYGSAEMREGMTAFLEKRKADFHGFRS
jgi:1,4-dihydroxy-2-naphthoyl-CoA synthase